MTTTAGDLSRLVADCANRTRVLSKLSANADTPLRTRQAVHCPFDGTPIGSIASCIPAGSSWT
jgi:hypothetical protein